MIQSAGQTESPTVLLSFPCQPSSLLLVSPCKVRHLSPCQSQWLEKKIIIIKSNSYIKEMSLKNKDFQGIRGKIINLFEGLLHSQVNTVQNLNV